MSNKKYPFYSGKPVLRILLLIPLLGDLLRVFLMDMGRVVPGLSLNVFNDRKINATVKQDATTQDRVRWFVEGIFFFVGLWGLLSIDKGGDLVLITSYLFMVFGIFAIVSAIFPKIRWNKRRQRLGYVIYLLFFSGLIGIMILGYVFLE